MHPLSKDESKQLGIGINEHEVPFNINPEKQLKQFPLLLS
jgi:hypothetical protein